MLPLDYYDQQCQAGKVIADPQQRIVLEKLQEIYYQLIDEQKSRSRWKGLFHRRKLVQGLYLWGSVGIGKTFIMDCFYQSLPFIEKQRSHFYAFMQMIHTELTQHQGESDPLVVIGKKIAKENLILCFDEFFVSDITDAMVLSRLLKVLFSNGVCLITTSNIKPDELYKNGLQRRQFLPAIELLKTHTDVMHITSQTDYRLRHLKEAGVFYTPLGELAEKNMQKTFSVLTSGEAISQTPIELNGRRIAIKQESKNVIWFDFKEICTVPRSQQDYLAIAKKYNTVFISDIPVILPQEKDTICLFIMLIDVLYDARIKLVISAAEPVEQIYSRGFKILEYTRTHSRLLEMQSKDYFS